MNILAEVTSGDFVLYVAIGVVAIIALVVVALVGRYFRLYVRAWAAETRIPILKLLGMTLRKVDPHLIVPNRIRAFQAGLDVGTDEMESHYLAGGDVPAVVSAVIAADRAEGIELTWEKATAIDLAGRDILDAVQTFVNPRVIDCPNPQSGRSTIDAVAKDGIQLKAKARVTVRASIERLVGGATEETIIARVGEGIVTTIGSAGTYKEVIENPDLISQKVLERGLDARTAFEIVSIDIADVDVGTNVGAELQAAQAEADKRRFQAEAEKRHAMAVAREQEMQAMVRENRAKVVLAEVEIPMAIADSFRKGNLGIMDYYRMKNVQADTQMRENIAGGPQTPTKKPKDT